MAIIKTEAATIEQENDFELFTSEKNTGVFVVCKRPDKLNSLLTEIDKAAAANIHFISDGYFSQYDLVIELVKRFAPCELYITTYALREFATKLLITAVNNGLISKISVLLETRIKTRDDVYELAKMNFSKVGLTSLHAKVTVIKSDKGYVTITGSANWTKNERIENGIISTQKEVAEFHINWIEKVLNNVEIFK